MTDFNSGFFLRYGTFIIREIYEYNNIYSINFSSFIFFIKVLRYKFKKNITSLRILLFIGLIGIAILFAVAGKFILTLPFNSRKFSFIKIKRSFFFQLIRYLD